MRGARLFAQRGSSEAMIRPKGLDGRFPKKRLRCSLRSLLFLRGPGFSLPSLLVSPALMTEQLFDFPINFTIDFLIVSAHIGVTCKFV